METGNVLITPPQALELGATVAKKVAEFLSKADAQHWITHPGELGEVLKPVLVREKPRVESAPAVISALNRPLADLGKMEFWLEMWNHLGWELNPSGLIVPAHQGDFNWLIVSPQGITPNKAYDINAELFRCWRYAEDLDAVVKSNDRDAGKGAYVIRIRDRIEADEELKNLSANNLRKKKIPAITLTERLILETAVFLVTGQHLDVHNWTLCAGSRRGDGDVPGCCWGGSKCVVDWYDPGHADGYRRGREVIS